MEPLARQQGAVLALSLALIHAGVAELLPKAERCFAERSRQPGVSIWPPQILATLHIVTAQAGAKNGAAAEPGDRFPLSRAGAGA
jgi:hypothetical protein